MSNKTANPNGYAGPERRKSVRRFGIDRRTMLRWEPGKGDRRQRAGHREHDQVSDTTSDKR